MYQNIVFDLDGTLIDSEEGLLNSFSYALEQLGYSNPGRETLRSVVGMPPSWAFEQVMHIPKESIPQAVSFYRGFYREKGLYQCALYPGMKELLQKLAAQGRNLAIATAKPLETTLMIVHNLEIERYFIKIVGAVKEASHIGKEALIAEAAAEFCSNYVMIGDRYVDIESAKMLGADTIGVGYGYGGKQELLDAGCTVFVPTVADLAVLLR